MRVPGVNREKQLQGLAVHELEVLLTLCLAVLSGVKCTWRAAKSSGYITNQSISASSSEQGIVLYDQCRRLSLCGQHSLGFTARQRSWSGRKGTGSDRSASGTVTLHWKIIAWTLRGEAHFWDNTSAVIYTQWGERCLADFIFQQRLWQTFCCLW